jgi:hypothetical protein
VRAGLFALGVILILAGVAVIVASWTTPCKYSAAPDCGYAPLNTLIGLVLAAGGIFLAAGATTGAAPRTPRATPPGDSADAEPRDLEPALRPEDAHRAEQRPAFAFALTLSAAMLVLVEGALVGYGAAVIGALGYAAAGAALSEVAALGLMFGFILLVLAIGLYFSRLNRGFISVGIVVFSVLSLFGGGGFLLGMILGSLGGVLGLLYVPDLIGDGLYEVEVDGVLYTRLRGRPARRRCPRCGGLVYSDEMICLRCGFAVSVGPVGHERAEAAEIPS